MGGFQKVGSHPQRCPWTLQAITQSHKWSRTDAWSLTELLGTSGGARRLLRYPYRSSEGADSEKQKRLMTIVDLGVEPRRSEPSTDGEWKSMSRRGNRSAPRWLVAHSTRATPADRPPVSRPADGAGGRGRELEGWLCRGRRRQQQQEKEDDKTSGARCRSSPSTTKTQRQRALHTERQMEGGIPPDKQTTTTGRRGRGRGSRRGNNMLLRQTSRSDQGLSGSPGTVSKPDGTYRIFAQPGYRRKLTRWAPQERIGQTSDKYFHFYFQLYIIYYLIYLFTFLLFIFYFYNFWNESSPEFASANLGVLMYGIRR